MCIFSSHGIELEAIRHQLAAAASPYASNSSGRAIAMRIEFSEKQFLNVNSMVWSAQAFPRIRQ